VLLRRPHPCNRTYYSETVNDADGLLVNAWRSMQMSPIAMAEAASWPVSEADMHARHLALLKWRSERNLELLMADPEWHDPKMAGWWAWGQSCWIGSGWCSGNGAWIVGADGRITKRPQAREPGVRRKFPHLADDGKGVTRPQAREPGVTRQLSQLTNGRGCVHFKLREPGVGEYHPMTMPELVRWFEFLSARLRHVRILNGDWKRLTTNSTTKILSVRGKKGAACGVFLDPPYDGTSDGLYSGGGDTVAAEVHAWCEKNGSDEKLRIALAGLGDYHDGLLDLGWRKVPIVRKGFLSGGMSNARKAGNNGNMKTEALWLSPHCLNESEGLALE
jgi:hypothetical protein